MDARHDGRSQVLDGQERASFESPAEPRTPLRSSRRKKVFPPIDEHLVVPEETRDEMVRGRKVVAMAALPPHADLQARLNFLIAAHAKPTYITSSELLTRVSEGSDFATDVCVRKKGLDPETGRRYLEELSFEIVYEQRMRLITDKASELAWRGVRRVFAIFVKRGEIGEWFQKQRKFVVVDQSTLFIDEAFVRPFPFKALLDIALGEEEVVKALHVKGNDEIARLREESADNGRQRGLKQGLDVGRKQGLDEGRKQGLDEGRKQGLDEGKLNGRRETLLEQLQEEFGSVPANVKKRIRSASIDELRAWSKKVLTSSSINDIFGAP